MLMMSATANKVTCHFSMQKAGLTTCTVGFGGRKLVSAIGHPKAKLKQEGAAASLEHLKMFVPIVQVKKRVEAWGPEIVQLSGTCKMAREYALYPVLQDLVFAQAFSENNTVFIRALAKRLALACTTMTGPSGFFFTLSHKMTACELRDKLLREGPTEKYELVMPVFPLNSFCP